MRNYLIFGTTCTGLVHPTVKSGRFNLFKRILNYIETAHCRILLFTFKIDFWSVCRLDEAFWMTLIDNDCHLCTQIGIRPILIQVPKRNSLSRTPIYLLLFVCFVSNFLQRLSFSCPKINDFTHFSGQLNTIHNFKIRIHRIKILQDVIGKELF